jgi:hypothetical protein
MFFILEFGVASQLHALVAAIRHLLDSIREA